MHPLIITALVLIGLSFLWLAVACCIVAGRETQRERERYRNEYGRWPNW